MPDDSAVSSTEDQIVAPSNDVRGRDLLQILSADDGSGRVVDGEDHRIGRDVELVVFVLSPGKPIGWSRAFGDAPDRVVEIGSGHRPHRASVRSIDPGHHVSVIDGVDVRADDVHSLDGGFHRRLPRDPVSDGSGGGGADGVKAIHFLATLCKLLVSSRIFILGNGCRGKCGQDGKGCQEDAAKRRGGHGWFDSLKVRDWPRIGQCIGDLLDPGTLPLPLRAETALLGDQTGLESPAPARLHPCSLDSSKPLGRSEGSNPRRLVAGWRSIRVTGTMFRSRGPRCAYPAVV